MTQAEAERMARNVRRFWAAHGHIVRAEAVLLPTNTLDHESRAWGVKSDLVNGLPPNCTPELLKALQKKANEV